MHKTKRKQFGLNGITKTPSKFIWSNQMFNRGIVKRKKSCTIWYMYIYVWASVLNHFFFLSLALAIRLNFFFFFVGDAPKFNRQCLTMNAYIRFTSANECECIWWLQVAPTHTAVQIKYLFWPYLYGLLLFEKEKDSNTFKSHKRKKITKNYDILINCRWNWLHLNLNQVNVSIVKFYSWIYQRIVVEFCTLHTTYSHIAIRFVWYRQSTGIRSSQVCLCFRLQLHNLNVK